MNRSGTSRACAVFALLLLGVACSSTNRTSSKLDASREDTALGGTVQARQAEGRDASRRASASKIGAADAEDTGVPGGAPAGSKRLFKPPGRGQGVTDREIKIGIHLYVIGGELLGSFGAASSETGPERPYWEAMISYLNASDGLARRSVKAVFHTTDPTTGSFAAHEQEACTALVEDAKVFAVVTGTQVTQQHLVACTASKKTPLFQLTPWPFDVQDFRRYAGLLYQPSFMRGDRWGTAYVDGLRAQGFFGSGSKVGLIRFDNEPFVRIAARSVKPRLAKYGVPLASEAAVTQPETTAGVGGLGSQIADVVLRFRTAGVNRVLFVEYNGVVPFLFMREAESQDFHPRYGFTSTDYPIFHTSNAPPSQLRGSVGVGWNFDADQLPIQRGALAAHHPTVGLCRSIYHKAGLNPAGYLRPCDALLLLRTVLARVPEVSVAALGTTIAQLGGEHASGATFRSWFGADRSDGAGAYRTFAYNEPCDCFRYSGGDRTVP